MVERDKKRVKLDSTSGIDVEFEKLQENMTPGSIKIVKNGVIKRRSWLVAYTTDEKIIVVDLNSGSEIYRSD